MNLKTNTKGIALWIILGLFLVSIFNIYQGTFRKEYKTLPLSQFIYSVQEGKMKQVVVRDGVMEGTDTSGNTSTCVYPTYAYNPFTFLINAKAYFQYVPQDTLSGIFMFFLRFIFPTIIFFVLYRWLLLKQMGGGSSGSRLMGFGRSKAKLFDPDKHVITFKDVAGIEEVKAELSEVVDFLKNPERFQEIGGDIPRGVLLYGPPGTGKTLMAKAVAGEAGVPFFSIAGSDFVEMFVGVGASRVRDLFAQAKQNSPCIIFIDEIDAVGRHRGGSGMGGGHDEREQTLNQFLVEMDGFESNEGVIVIAATNRADVLDPALLRPGRFDRRIPVDLPDLLGREAILQVHGKKIKLAKDVDLREIAKGTIGFSGADLKNLCNEGALLAARMGRKEVTRHDLEESLDKIVMGLERKTKIITENDKAVTAYHEAGHALVAYHSPQSDPIHKATIVPRGIALGMVVRLPDTDRVSMTKARLEADLAVAMAGRLAEEVIFGKDNITTGASGDFSSATSLAHKMVFQWGMSEVLGTVMYSNDKDYSEEVKQKGDQEVRRIIDDASDRGRFILDHHGDQLHLLAKYLLSHETLTGAQIHELLTTGALAEDEKTDPLALENGSEKENSPENNELSQNNESSEHDGSPKSPELLEKNPSEEESELSENHDAPKGNDSSKMTHASEIEDFSHEDLPQIHEKEKKEVTKNKENHEHKENHDDNKGETSKKKAEDL